MGRWEAVAPAERLLEQLAVGSGAQLLPRVVELHALRRRLQR